LVFKSYSFKSYLPLGNNAEEATHNSNLFFPKMFDGNQNILASSFIEKLNFHGRYVLPVNQKLYIASKALKTRFSGGPETVQLLHNEGGTHILETFFFEKAPHRELSALVNLANFTYVNPDILLRFPDVISSEEEQFAIFKFDHTTTSDYVESTMLARGFAPCGMIDLMRFAIEMPQFQQSIPVVALGARWNHSEVDSMVPAIWGGSSSRDLNMCSRGTRWFAGDAFLAHSGVCLLIKR
jgi:hypothetical protein